MTIHDESGSAIAETIQRNAKRVVNLNEDDIRNIAARVWHENSFFDRKGVMISLDAFVNDFLGHAEEYAENFDRHNPPCQVGE